MAPHSCLETPQTQEPGGLQSMGSLSRVRLFTTPWTAAYQGPPSMGFSRQEYWSGVPLPSLRIFHYLPLFLYFPPPLLFNHSVHSDGLLLMLWFSLLV